MKTKILAAVVATSPVGVFMVFFAAFFIVIAVVRIVIVARQVHLRKKQSRLLLEETRSKVAPYWVLFAAIADGRLRFTNGGQWYYTDEEGRLVVADLGARGSERFEVYDASDVWAQNYLRDNPPRPPDHALALSMGRNCQLFERLTEAY
jgi:hypothetical protein